MADGPNHGALAGQFGGATAPRIGFAGGTGMPITAFVEWCIKWWNERKKLKAQHKAAKQAIADNREQIAENQTILKENAEFTEDAKKSGNRRDIASLRREKVQVETQTKKLERQNRDYAKAIRRGEPIQG